MLTAANPVAAYSSGEDDNTNSASPVTQPPPAQKAPSLQPRRPSLKSRTILILSPSQPHPPPHPHTHLHRHGHRCHHYHCQFHHDCYLHLHLHLHHLLFSHPNIYVDVESKHLDDEIVALRAKALSLNRAGKKEEALATMRKMKRLQSILVGSQADVTAKAEAVGQMATEANEQVQVC